MSSSSVNLIRRLPPLPTITDILRMYGIRAKKNLSQNFILDPRILKKFARIAGNLNDKSVIEVGPGPGGITRALIEAGAKEVHVIEKDPRFLPSLTLLQEAAGNNRLHIKIGDCLQYNPEDTFPETMATDWNSPKTNFALVGNLPFNVATPLLIKLLEAMHSRSNIYSFGRVPSVFTFQHEVAHRMVAPPGDPERSRLSVVCQNWAEVNYAYNLPGGAFVPPPEVEVGVVKLTPLKEPYINGFPFSFINKVVTAIFSGKQKQLKNSLTYSLFPKTKDDISKKLLDAAEVPWDEMAINLNMTQIRNICIAYHHLCEEVIAPSKKEKITNYIGPKLLDIQNEDEVEQNMNQPTTSAVDSTIPRFDIRL